MDEDDEQREYEEGFGQHDHYVELIKLCNVMIITTHVITYRIILLLLLHWNRRKTWCKT